MKFIIICNKGREHQEDIQRQLFKQGYRWYHSNSLEPYKAATSEFTEVIYYIDEYSRMLYSMGYPTSSKERQDVLDNFYKENPNVKIYFDKVPNILMETE